jgi:hypothetical protein
VKTELPLVAEQQLAVCNKKSSELLEGTDNYSYLPSVLKIYCDCSPLNGGMYSFSLVFAIVK